MTFKHIMLTLAILGVGMSTLEGRCRRRCRSRGNGAAGFFVGALTGTAIAAAAYEDDYYRGHVPLYDFTYYHAPLYAYDYPAYLYSPAYAYRYTRFTTYPSYYTAY